MPKVLPAIFSYEDMKSRFAQDNPDDPYTRRKDLETGLYALDNWLIRVDDDNKAISTVGFKEHPSHTVVGGMYASAKGRQIGGNNRALQMAREPQLNQSKPLVAAFGHRDGDNARWISKAKQNGWIFPDSENWEQAKQMLPESVVNEWNSAYPNGNWAIRSIRGEGEFAKCFYLDDPTPSWFNLLKYLPDNTWDDFELGEPAPDLGTRDRFKDKNIQSKGKAEYKAFVTQQYLRQVSDRIPNAGTSLMQGWLEKLTEMNLNKGKYWFFGTNVQQDNTYVMIDVISKGQPYTATADKKFNLEDMDKAIIFVGVSKEMVGKVKRGQGIPKGRKFLDIHGKYGVRGLRRGRRLPKEPKNIFPTFEKSWKDILKILPDSTFNTMLDDTDDETKIISTARKDNDNPHKYSGEHNIAFRPHYLVRAKSKRIADHPDAKRTDLLPELADKIRELNLKTAGWAYLTDNPEDFAYITFAPFPPNYNADYKDMVSDSPPIVGKYKNKFDRQSMWRNPLKKVLIFLDSVRPTTQGYPLSSFDTFYDIWGTGIKDGHEGGDYAGHSEHIKEDEARQKRVEDAEQQFAEAFARRTDYQKAELAYKNWMNQIRIADIKTQQGREIFRLPRREHLKNLEQIQMLGEDKFAKNLVNAKTANKKIKEKKKIKMAKRFQEVIVPEYKKFLMNLKEADDREQARLRDLKANEKNKQEE